MVKVSLDYDAHCYAQQVARMECHGIRGCLFTSNYPGLRFAPSRLHLLLRQDETHTSHSGGPSKASLLPPAEFAHDSLDVPLTEIVNVPAGKTVEVPIDTGLQIIAPETIKPPYYWALMRPGDEKPLARFRETLDPQVVPARDYRLVWRQSEHYSPSVEFGTVTIEAGKLNKHAINSGIQIRRADWIEKAPYFVELVRADGKSLGQWWDAEGAQLVPEGKYSVLYRQSEHYHSTIELGEITVPPSGMADVTINSGVKFVPQAEAKPPYKAIFMHLDSGKEFDWNGKATGWQPVPLPPGRYKLDWWEDEHKTKRMTLIDEFEIEPGTLVEFQM
jgi:hypothetical protein